MSLGEWIDHVCQHTAMTNGHVCALKSFYCKADDSGTYIHIHTLNTSLPKTGSKRGGARERTDIISDQK